MRISIVLNGLLMSYRLFTPFTTLTTRNGQSSINQFLQSTGMFYLEIKLKFGIDFMEH